MGLFELGGEADQRRFVSDPPDELRADRAYWSAKYKGSEIAGCQCRAS